jgi:hypothetical protein
VYPSGDGLSGPDLLKETLMQVVGYIALIVVALFVLFGLALAVVAIPDVRRYRRMRSM